MREKNFRFYYFLIFSFMIISVIFLVSYEGYTENFKTLSANVIGLTNSKPGKANIALINSQGGIVYKRINVRYDRRDKIYCILEALFEYESSGSALHNYIHPLTRVLDFSVDGNRVYVTLSNNFKNIEPMHLDLAYSQLKMTIKDVYKDMEECTVIFNDSVITI